jgi:hypothetical protein
MFVKEDFSQTLASQEPGLSAFKPHFFEFLSPFSLELCRRKGGFASKLVDELQQRLSVIAEASERNRAGVLAGAYG